MALLSSFRGLRIGAFVALIVAFLCSTVVNAQTCNGVIPSFCTEFVENSRTSYFDSAITGYTRLSDNEIENRLTAIDNSTFCENCRAGLKKMLCELYYPACTTGGSPQPRFPCKARCDTLLNDACGTNSIEQINFRFGLLLDDIQIAQLRNLGFGTGSSCASMYTSFDAAYATTSTQCVQITYISNPTNCRCSAVNTADFPFCGPYLGAYPVWDYVSRNASLFDEEASFRYLQVQQILAPGSVHAPCDDCLNEMKRAVCQSFIPKCATPQVPVQKACKSSCDRVLSVCRTRDTLDPKYLAAFTSLQLGVATSQEIAGIDGYCSGEEFTTSTSCNAASPATVPPKCPCSPPPALTVVDYCKDFINYPIHSTTATVAPTIEDKLRTYLAPFYNITNPVFYRVCPNCNNTMVEAMCRMAYPKCTVDGVRTVRNDTCETAAGVCKVSGFKGVCERWVSGIPIDNTADQISVRSPCTCTTLSSELVNSLSASCRPYVNYPVPFGWGSSAAVTIVSNEVNVQITKFDQVKSLLCKNCSDSIIKTICEAYFPRCEDENHIVPSCASGCRGNLQSCGLPGLANSFCGLLQNEAAGLPGITSCFDSSADALTGRCTYCGRRQDTGQCREYVDWDTYSGSLPGLDITKFTNLAEFVLPTINFPNCSLCTFQIRRTMCSVFVLPCNDTIVDKLVSKFISLPSGTINTEDALNAVTRPCFSTCQSVLADCLKTLPPNPKNFFFACDAKLPGLPPNLDLYAKVGDCVAHSYPSLPGTCPLYQAPAPKSGTNINGSPGTAGSGAPGTSNGVVGGLSSGGIVGIVLVAVVIPIIIAATFAILYIRRLWIFRIKTVDLDSIQPDDDYRPREVSLEPTDWSKAKKPRVVSNLK